MKTWNCSLAATDRRMVPLRRLRGLARIADLNISSRLEQIAVSSAASSEGGSGRLQAPCLGGWEGGQIDRSGQKSGQESKSRSLFCIFFDVCRMQWTRFGLEANDE